MKKIAVVAANGRAGKLIVKEAVERGHDVTVFVREENQTAAEKAVQKDIMDITAEDLAGFDAVVDAFGAWAPDTLGGHVATSQHLCDVLSGTDVRPLVVGGAGSLYVNPEHTACVADGPDFPDAFKPLAAAQGEELEKLRSRNDVAWTFVSPAADFQADGERTGAYILGGEELTLNEAGESVISYADYAIAMVDERLGDLAASVRGGKHRTRFARDEPCPQPRKASHFCTHQIQLLRRLNRAVNSLASTLALLLSTSVLRTTLVLNRGIGQRRTKLIRRRLAVSSHSRLALSPIQSA